MGWTARPESPDARGQESVSCRTAAVHTKPRPVATARTKSPGASFPDVSRCSVPTMGSTAPVWPILRLYSNVVRSGSRPRPPVSGVHRGVPAARRGVRRRSGEGAGDGACQVRPGGREAAPETGSLPEAGRDSSSSSTPGPPDSGAPPSASHPTSRLSHARRQQVVRRAHIGV